MRHLRSCNDVVTKARVAMQGGYAFKLLPRMRLPSWVNPTQARLSDDPIDGAPIWVFSPTKRAQQRSRRAIELIRRAVGHLPLLA